MKRWILNGTFALAIAVSPLDLTNGMLNFGPVAAYAQNVDPVVMKTYKSAKRAFKKARKSLNKAKKNDGDIDAAQQIFDAAKADLAAAAVQLKQAEAEAKAYKRAATEKNKRKKSKDFGEAERETEIKKAEETAPTTKKLSKRQKKKLRAEEKKRLRIAKQRRLELLEDAERQKAILETVRVKKAKGPMAPPTPSADAPKAKDIADVSIETQIKKATKTATAVVPDNVTKTQKNQLRAAERKRRKKAKEHRQELLGAVAVGVAVGVLLPALGGRVVEDQGDRVVVERDGNYFVRKDESALFRDDARNVEIVNLRGGRTLETIYRQNGSRIETVRDAGGYVLRRVKIDRFGVQHVLFDSRNIDNRRRVDYDRELPPIQLRIPYDEYDVSGGRMGRRSLTRIFRAGPVEQVREQYSLRDVRESRRLRSIVRSVDLDTINFESGSFIVRESQVYYLADIAGSMLDTIDANPNAVFLLEGHTDAVGSEISNAVLSDRRAETVARILVEAFDVPPENLVTQGYGE